MPTIAHLTASTFLGGPERQMLGLAAALPARFTTSFIAFSEGGRCEPFLRAARGQGHDAIALTRDTPRVIATLRELTAVLNRAGADLVCCHGYKANLLGRIAARRAGIPVVGVSRGWTAESRKIRIYEALDRWSLRWMDQVVAVSEGQAEKVRRAGVPGERLQVIRNAIRADRFARPYAERRAQLHRMLPTVRPLLVGAAGRLSPEKGFGVFIDAAARVAKDRPDVGFFLFGDGPLRDELTRQVKKLGLQDRFVLAGLRTDLDALMPMLDLTVLPSFTEGLPNVVLESLAAGVPVVATAVGGTPEVLEDGRSGCLVPPHNADALAKGITKVLADEPRRRQMGLWGQRRVREEFTFEAQARQYEELFEEMLASPRPAVGLAQHSRELEVSR